MTAPLAYTVHPGGRAPNGQEQQVLAQWLPANGINPNLVSAEHPITVLPVPLEGTGDGPWMIQVIVFQQIHVDHTGAADYNLITGSKVTFQRTVPLRVPFPTAPTTDGEDRGQEPQVGPVEDGQRAPQHQGGPQEDEQQTVRPAETEDVQDRRSGSRPERPGQGLAARIASAEEGRSEGSGAQVPEPEEEEVGADR